MNKIYLKLSAILAAIVIVIQGCAALQTTAPKTLEERIAVSYITLTYAVNASTAMVNSGRISKAVGNEVLEQGLSIFNGLQLAETTARAGDLTSAENQLKAMQVLILALNQRIAQLEAQSK